MAWSLFMGVFVNMEARIYDIISPIFNYVYNANGTSSYTVWLWFERGCG